MNTDSVLGRQLDEYQLQTLLGHGGMARVYRAVDLRLRRYTAVKVIATPFRSDAAYIQRFESEAQAIARLDHPHIVQIYRFGEAAGFLYIAMQYIAGADLGVLLAGYRQSGEWLSADETRRLVRQVGSALDYAHGQGVIHRDIKPANIVLDEQGRAFVTDFGLALLPELGGMEVFGSPHYMSPEQVIASSRVVPQSDLYSLGVILYEIFTGRLPFLGAEPNAVAAMHLHNTPPPPSQFRPELPPAVEAVILKALAKDPAQRFATGQALADALDAALAGGFADSVPPTLPRLSMPDRVKQQAAQTNLPPLAPAETGVAAPPTTPLLPVAHPAPRRRWGLWLAGAIGLAAVLLGGTWLTSWGLSQLIPSAPPLTSTAGATLPTAATASPPSTEVAPTALPTSLPTLPPTLAPTLLPSPSATPDARVTYTLVLTRGPQSNYLVLANHTDQPFPLARLRLGTGADAIEGDEWEINPLAAGQCVTAWKDDRTAERADATKLTCITGELVVRDGKTRFWRETFDIYFNEELLGQCKKNATTCTVQVSAVR